MKLSSLKVGSVAKIREINLNEKSLKRFATLGLTVGAKVKIIRFAPLNCPIEIKVNNSYLAIRKGDADLIKVSLYE